MIKPPRNIIFFCNMDIFSLLIIRCIYFLLVQFTFLLQFLLVSVLYIPLYSLFLLLNVIGLYLLLKFVIFFIFYHNHLYHVKFNLIHYQLHPFHSLINQYFHFLPNKLVKFLKLFIELNYVNEHLFKNS